MPANASLNITNSDTSIFSWPRSSTEWPGIRAPSTATGLRSSQSGGAPVNYAEKVCTPGHAVSAGYRAVAECVLTTCYGNAYDRYSRDEGGGTMGMSTTYDLLGSVQLRDYNFL